jgi:ubiquitin-like 1-activating enzyme E1 A
LHRLNAPLTLPTSIRKANILLIRIKALANEVAKNLVLAGVGSLTIIDHDLVKDEDLGAQFFISDRDIGTNRAEAAAPEIQKLNPRVKLNVDTDDIRQKSDLQAFLSPFDIIIATDFDFPTAWRINAATRMNNQAFYAAGAHGLYGYIFSDLVQHTFSIERKRSNVPTKLGPETRTRSIISTTAKNDSGEIKEIVTKAETYSPLVLANTSPLPGDILKNRRRMKLVHPLLPCFRALWDFEKLYSRAPNPQDQEDIRAILTIATEKNKELQLPTETLTSQFFRSFLQNLGAELAPVTAWLGGQLAQDVINVLGKREQPIQNFVFFDGEEYNAPIYSLHPFFDEPNGNVAEAKGVSNGAGASNGAAGIMVID